MIQLVKGSFNHIPIAQPVTRNQQSISLAVTIAMPQVLPA